MSEFQDPTSKGPEAPAPAASPAAPPYGAPYAPPPGASYPPPPGTPYPPPPPVAAWPAVRPTGRKSPALAGVLSFLLPGLGQVYLGYYQRGFMYALIFASLVGCLASGFARGVEPVFGIFMAFFYLYNVIDAVRRASLYNQALAGLSPVGLPEDFKMPTGRSSLLGGALLLVLGIVFLGHTRFDYDLDWLADWWPAILVIIGAHMVYKAMRERKA